MARATGAEVWVPKIEAFVLADIMSFVPWPGFGPFESYDAEHTLEGGERLELAGFEIDVLFTPGHSPGHVTFSIPDEQAIFSGDVLFQQSIGRTDLPGGDYAHAAGVDPRRWSSRCRGRPPSIRATWAPRRWRGAGHQPVPGRAGEVKKLQAPRGTLDVLPPDARRRLRLVEIADDVLGRAGYEPMETPVFEDTELFARGVGESTDIVQKEMFTFEDKAGRSLTLRPEATAGICRAYIEHGMHKLPQPVKVWTAGPFFRHEAPQAGRFRQFTQIDAEALGSDDPTLDAELILLLAEIFERAGTGPSRLRLSSLGTPETRADYIDELSGIPARARGRAVGGGARAARAEPAARLRRRPPRHPGGDGGGAAPARPADRRGRRALRRGAGAARRRRAARTRSIPRSCAGSTTTRARCSSSSRSGSGPRRRSAAAAATTGWSRSSAGRRRRAWAGPRASSGCCSRPASAEQDHGIDVFVAGTGRDAFVLVGQLRSSGLRAQMEQAGRSLKGQLKQADRLGARWTVILGDEIEVKDMDTGAQQRAESRGARSWEWSAREASAPQPLPDALGRASCAPTTSATRCAWPAGCTAGATTAG